jgi:hypothetical protein
LPLRFTKPTQQNGPACARPFGIAEVVRSLARPQTLAADAAGVHHHAAARRHGAGADRAAIAGTGPAPIAAMRAAVTMHAGSGTDADANAVFAGADVDLRACGGSDACGHSDGDGNKRGSNQEQFLHNGVVLWFDAAATAHDTVRSGKRICLFAA